MSCHQTYGRHTSRKLLRRFISRIVLLKTFIKISAIIFSGMLILAYKVSCIYVTRGLVWVGYGTGKKSRSGGRGHGSVEEAVGCSNGWERWEVHR